MSLVTTINLFSNCPGPPGQVAAVAGKKAGYKQGELGGILKELGYTEDQVSPSLYPFVSCFLSTLGTIEAAKLVLFLNFRSPFERIRNSFSTFTAWIREVGFSCLSFVVVHREEASQPLSLPPALGFSWFPF